MPTAVLQKSLRQGLVTNDPYDAARDRFGRIKRYQWENHSGATGGTERFHLAHAFDGASNRLFDEDKVYETNSKVFAFDDLDRVVGRDDGLIDLSGTPEIDSFWLADGRDWGLDHLGNPVDGVNPEDNIDTDFAEDYSGVVIDKANQITKNTHKADALMDRHDAEFTASAEVDLFTTVVRGSGSTSITASHSGSDFVKISSGSATDPGLAIMGPEVGIVPFGVEFKVPTIPSSGTTGLVGYVFGYKSINDYWVIGKDMETGDGKWYLYHMHDSVIRRTRTLLWLATFGLLAAATAGVVGHLTSPVQIDEDASASSGPHDQSPTRGSADAQRMPDRAALQQVATRDIRQRLFDPPVVVPKPPPPKPLPPIELLSTILRSSSGGNASAWVRDGQTTRKVMVGDTIGPESNPATVTAIQTNRLLLGHEGREVEVGLAGTGGGGRR